ncbi:MAG: DUF1893 domain-containing protein [Ruminococcaceae bacterium]|nr:DUF1893 domain-containing protein [Oscillospiraceae bacterium]
MDSDLMKAKELLLNSNHTCVLMKDGKCYFSDHRGVKPLLQWLDDGIDLRDFAAADKVVGKAAAYLYVLLGVKAVYARVISSPSIAVLEEHGISVFFETKVDAIRNRTNTGLCPMEQAVKTAQSPQEALIMVRQALEKLK